MHNELTNLLPPERERKLSRDYILRIGVVSIMLATVLTVIAAVLLIPTYVLLDENMKTKKGRLADIESKFSSADETSLSARLTALSDNAAILTALSAAPSASSITREILAVSRPGITLSSLSYEPSANKSLGSLIISGTSQTRDALRNYQIEIQDTAIVRSATLPVSAYAKDSDIAFTITVTLAP